jgi:hypothetical protein
LFLNLAARANTQVTGENMMFTPINKKSGRSCFQLSICLANSISEEQYAELEEGIERRFNNALLMCGIKDTLINFEVNTYLAAK